SISSNTARALVLAVGLLLGGGCLAKLGGGIVFAQEEPGLAMTQTLWPGAAPSQTAVMCLLAAMIIVLLCLLQGFAYAGYRTRGLTARHRAIHALTLARTLVLLSIVFLVV